MSVSRFVGISVVKKPFLLQWDFKNDHESNIAQKQQAQEQDEHRFLGKRARDGNDNRKNDRNNKYGKKRGMNKNRKGDEVGIAKPPPKDQQLCPKIAQGLVCEEVLIGKESNEKSCGFMHDLKEYLESREPDLVLENNVSKNVAGDLMCPIFAEFAVCPYGFKCLFSKSHLVEENSILKLNFPLKNTDQGTPLHAKFDASVLNNVPFDLIHDIRKKNYTYELRDERLNELRNDLDFSEKIYVAPLTTVGNLPFRRIVKEFGADITCSEMGMARQLLEGKLSEWALVKKHPSETFFGIQLADSDPEIMAKTAVLLKNELGSGVSFIDLNLGCPIDLVTNYGAGSALMNRDKKFQDMLEEIVRRVKGTVPIGIKMRTGWNTNKPTAHKLCCKVQTWQEAYPFPNSIAYVSIHGRSRQMRYTKVADWDYINKTAARVHGKAYLNCLSKNRQMQKDELEEKLRNFQPIKVFGNGDIMSYIDWERHLSHVNNWFTELDDLEAEDEVRQLQAQHAANAIQMHDSAAATIDQTERQNVMKTNTFSEDDLLRMKVNLKSKLTTCMIARGALIKPWLCQELKERRHIDLSSSERFEMLKKFVNYGLQHWGTDRKGVNNTRRFLLEWMSFLYRYVPVGLLEQEYIPQHMNDRPPKFKGRDELETLMGSPNVQDWVKISEMLLGKVEENYNFVPKHKANAFDQPSEEVVSNFLL